MIKSGQSFMNKQISPFSQVPGHCQSPEVEMEDKNKDTKHKNKQGKAVFENTTNKFFSTSVTTPSTALRICHQSSSGAEPGERKCPSYQCSANFKAESCLKQHLQIHSSNSAFRKKCNLTGDALNTQLRYWKDKLMGYETLNLFTDYPRPSQLNHIVKDIYFELDTNTSINLRILADELNVSLYVILLTGYYLMLRGYSNQDDIVIGTSMADWHYSQFAQMTGMTANALALRIQTGSATLLKDLIEQVSCDIITCQRHQDLPFETLVEELAENKDTSKHPIFQVMFVLQNIKISLQNQGDKKTDLHDSLKNHARKSPHSLARFDFTTVFDDSEKVLKGMLIYATNLYRKETMHRFLETYTHILSQLSTLNVDRNKKEHITIENLSYLNAEQYNQIIYKWNATDKEYPTDKTIHQLFEEQVAKTPDNVAIVYEDVKLTYRELNERANQVAGYLIDEYNIEPDGLVPLCLDRSEHMIIAILAVLKAGGAYVPIDPNYPAERIQFILKDTRSNIIITNEIHRKMLESISSSGITNQECLEERRPLNILFMDSLEFEDKLSSQAITNPNTATISTHLAYVIYTSGTTGKPKGVMIEHRGLVNLNYALVNRYAVGDANETEIILQLLNFVFDASVEDLLLGLLNGHALLVVPNNLWLNKEKFNSYLFVNKVTHIHATPTFLQQYNFSEIPSLRRLVFGGEFFSKQSYDKICLKDSVNIINAYGPTETTVTSVVKTIEKGDLNLGSPIFNTRCYVLSKNLVPVPPGAIGELYIGGAGLARGYLNRPDLTAERFIANPFQTKEERSLGKYARLYKTGDLVRWLSDGNLEYIGRNDLQVKIRGYRIELEEIESALMSYKGIKQSTVLAKEHRTVESESSGNKYLVGYYVSDDKLDEEAVLHYLGSKLPNYMVPTILVRLNELPLTVNGKLDRKSLPAPEFVSKDDYVAPKNEIEEKACQIWAEVLRLDMDKIGTQDDFFRLGGDSIVGIQLVSRFRTELRLNFSVRDIFRCRTIAKLCENVLTKNLGIDIESSLRTEQGILVGTVPILPLHEWFFSRDFSDAHHWNQSFLIKTPRLDITKLQGSLDKLVQHHDCFRLRFEKDVRFNTYKQYYDGNASVERVRVLDITTLGYHENSKAFKIKLQEFLSNWQANFHLMHGPMYSVGYIYGYQDGSARIHFALHHLIVDVVSWRILCEDLRNIYYGKRLGSKGSSYRQWAKVLQEYPVKHPEEELFWNDILSDCDSSQLENLGVSKATSHFTRIALSQDYTNLLLQESNKFYHTQINDLLLTALGCSLTEITGVNIHHILLESHDREEIDASIDITRTVGWFTAIYPIRLEILNALDTSIRHIKESLRRIPHKRFALGKILRDKSDSLPRVYFTFLDRYGQENIDKLKDKDVWKIVGEYSGISVSPNNWDTTFINFSGLIIDDRLEFHIVSRLCEKTTNYLAKVFKQQLEFVINHTINQPRSFLTVSDIDYVVSKERLDALQESREIQSIYLANNLQQGFIYHAVRQGDVDDAYFEQNFWQYHCPLNISNLKQAWEYAQNKFSSLRLKFDWQERLVQIIYKKDSFDWHYLDVSDALDKEKQENLIKEIREKDRSQRFDLTHGNLFRIYVIKQNLDLYHCIFSYHHAILDGWSIPILLKYIHETYLRLDRREPIVLQPDHAYEAAQHYIQKHQEDSKTFWEKYIANVKGRSNLSGLLLNSDKRLSQYKQIIQPTDETLAITGNLYKSLKELSQQEGVTLNAILQYVWHKVLHVYGNNKQTIVGTTLSGRSMPIDDIENSVGLYINTVPLIVDHEADSCLIESIKNIQSSITELNEMSIVNLAKLQPSDERLFDSLFIYENYPNPTGAVQDEVKFSFKGAVEKLDYPLNVKAYEVQNKIIFQIQYAGELFKVDTINNLLTLTRTLLEQLPSHAHQAVGNLRYLNAQQCNQITHLWNATDKEYPTDKTIHQLFEEQVAKTPNNVAIVYEEVKLTYRKLNERANQVANYLINEYNIEPDGLITLCLDRSEHMIIAILAVLKSGGAYVPIDPSYPDERIQYILQDTGASLLLTNEIYRERIEGISCLANANQKYLKPTRQSYILSVDSHAFQENVSVQAVTNPNTVTTSTHLAYVIYTSGTTGKPKGVMVEHGGLVNLHFDLTFNYALGDAINPEVILHLLNYVFDASLEQFIISLLNGHVLLLLPDQSWLNKEKFINYLLVNKVTHITATPKFLEQHNFKEVLSLKRLVSGGDLLSKQSYDKIYLNDSIRMINNYGPTETTITALIKILKKGDLNIGSPISNTKAYVLAKNLVPVPVGATGELYIGGAGLARGYLNRPELTAERFIPNPFQTEEERRHGKYARLYQTGDLVKWLPNGNLEYIGRKDLQVKIRGYRIELGEIEAALLGYQGIKQSVALAKERKTLEGEPLGDKFLVGYYVSDEKLDVEAVLNYLGLKLPHYMIPTALIHLNQLPLTINGKLDEKALPDPEFTNKNNYVAPRNEIEEKVRQIWAEVLRLDEDKIGVQDDFFRLGGDSIISIQLVSRLRRDLQISISVKDIFSCRTIARLYKNFLTKELCIDSGSSLQTEQGILVGAVPLLLIQEWFFSRNFSKPHYWNQSCLIKTASLDISKLQDSLDKLIQHHDCFRLRFEKDERLNTYKQYYDGTASVERVRVLDITTFGYHENSKAFKIKLQEFLSNWQANFHLMHGPMYSVGYIYGYQDGSARIHFALHHLIVDVVSWRILCEDLRNIYYGKSLGSKGSSYRQWAKVLKDYPTNHPEEELYWNKILSDCDTSQLENLMVSKATSNFSSIALSQEYTSLLLQESNKSYHTQINDLLLTALGYSLVEITGNNINHIVLVSHGREEIDSSIDITRTVGWFNTIYPVRLEVFSSLETSIRSIKESLRTIPHKGLGFGPIIGFKVDNLPRVNFNYVGHFGSENIPKIKDNDIWQIVREDSGISWSPDNWDSHVIYMNGLIFNGRLEFSIESKLDKMLTDKIASVFKQQLEVVINHTKMDQKIT